MYHTSENEYEMIRHEGSLYKVFLVSLLYRTPHIHRDFEICLMLRGEAALRTPGSCWQLHEGDVFLMNPFQSHEIIAQKPVLILSLQITPSFFSAIYPSMDRMEFKAILLCNKQAGSQNYAQKPAWGIATEPVRYIEKNILSAIHSLLTKIELETFSAGELYEFSAAGKICSLFHILFRCAGYYINTEKEQSFSRKRGRRMRSISAYIDAHYTEKLLLSDIAGQEELSLYYLSHFFKKCFGMSFQEYLSRIRCEHARRLLLTTDMNLLDISLASGFSDTKYFTGAFKRLYGQTPGACRKAAEYAPPDDRKQSLLTTQEFLDAETALKVLQDMTKRQ